MSPVPPSYSYWWKSTIDEPQWSDQQLDAHASVLCKPTLKTTARWLTEEEHLELEKTPKLAIEFEDEAGNEKEVAYVFKELIMGLSRDVKDTIQFNLQEYGHETTRISDWFHYLVLVFGRPCYDASRERPCKERRCGVGVEVYERREELWRASKVFFQWLVTGKVVVEKNEDGVEVGKELLLALARALGAPLFRKAVLRDCEGEIGANALFSNK